MKILIAGEGGQGIQTIAKTLSDIVLQNNYQIVYMPHYGVEMRMGISLAYAQIDKDKIVYPKFSIADIVLVLARRDLESTKTFINEETNVINCINLLDQITDKKISKKSFNMFCLGLLINQLKKQGIIFRKETIYTGLQNILGNKTGMDENIYAINLGLDDNQKIYSDSLDNIKEIIYNPLVTENSNKSHIRFANLCKGCGICINICPTKALFWSKEYKNFIERPMPEVNIDKCIACGICQQNCPDCAIRVIKK